MRCMSTQHGLMESCRIVCRSRDQTFLDVYRSTVRDLYPAATTNHLLLRVYTCVGISASNPRVVASVSRKSATPFARDAPREQDSR
jgi:hypothetical protein